MNFSQFRRGSSEVENFGSETAATPCPDEDAMTSFLNFRCSGNSGQIVYPTSDTKLEAHEA